jgi:hypothetical protein
MFPAEILRSVYCTCQMWRGVPGSWKHAHELLEWFKGLSYFKLDVHFVDFRKVGSKRGEMVRVVPLPRGSLWKIMVSHLPLRKIRTIYPLIVIVQNPTQTFDVRFCQPVEGSQTRVQQSDLEDALLLEIGIIGSNVEFLTVIAFLITRLPKPVNTRLATMSILRGSGYHVLDFIFLLNCSVFVDFEC